jgi:hypothetical protein
MRRLLKDIANVAPRRVTSPLLEDLMSWAKLRGTEE